MLNGVGPVSSLFVSQYVSFFFSFFFYICSDRVMPLQLVNVATDDRLVFIIMPPSTAVDRA